MQISKPDSHSPMCNWIVDVSHSIIPKHESEPVTMQNVPTLNDVDMQRLKAESLFLVSTTESSVDIGGTLEFAQCLHDQIIRSHLLRWAQRNHAYALSSLEYHCLVSNIATDKVRPCRQRVQPSIGELEAMLVEIECTKRMQ